MNCLDDVKDVVFIGRVMTVPVFVVQTSERGHHKGTESFEVIDKCSRQYSALVTPYLLLVVLEG